MVKIIEPLKVNGVDRINSNIGYEINNVVSCCSKCNYAKHMMNKKEFLNWVEKIYLFNF